jgi:hypothetical protein
MRRSIIKSAFCMGILFMTNRNSPWWLPLAFIASLLMCVMLLTTLIMDRSKVSHTDSPVNDASSASQKDAVYRWRLVTTWPKKYPGLGLAPENFAEKLRVMSGYRIRGQRYCARARRF